MTSIEFRQFISSVVDNTLQRGKDLVTYISALTELEQYIEHNEPTLPLQDRRQAIIEKIQIYESLIALKENGIADNQAYYESQIRHLEVSYKNLDNRTFTFVIHDLIKIINSCDTIDEIKLQLPVLVTKYWEQHDLSLLQLLNEILELNASFEQQNLESRTIQIIQSRFKPTLISENGSYTTYYKSLQDIADEHNLSRERIRQIEASALYQLAEDYTAYNYASTHDCEKWSPQDICTVSAIDLSKNHIRCVDKLLEELISKILMNNNYEPQSLHAIVKVIADPSDSEDNYKCLLSLLLMHKKVKLQIYDQLIKTNSLNNFEVCLHKHFQNSSTCENSQSAIIPFRDSITGSCEIITVFQNNEPDESNMLVRGSFCVPGQSEAMQQPSGQSTPMIEYIQSAGKEAANRAKSGPISLESYVNMFIGYFNNGLPNEFKSSQIQPLYLKSQRSSLCRQLQTLNDIRIIEANDDDQYKHGEYVLHSNTYNSLSPTQLLYVKSILYASDSPEHFKQKGTSIWDIHDYVTKNDPNHGKPTFHSITSNFKRWNENDSPIKFDETETNFYTFRNLSGRMSNKKTPSPIDPKKLVIAVVRQHYEKSDPAKESPLTKSMLEDLLDPYVSKGTANKYISSGLQEEWLENYSQNSDYDLDAVDEIEFDEDAYLNSLNRRNKQTGLSQTQALMQVLSEFENGTVLFESDILSKVSTLHEAISSENLTRHFNSFRDSKILTRVAPGEYLMDNIQKVKLILENTDSKLTTNVPDAIDIALSKLKFVHKDSLYDEVCVIKPDTMFNTFQSSLKRMLQNDRIRMLEDSYYSTNSNNSTTNAIREDEFLGDVMNVSYEQWTWCVDYVPRIPKSPSELQKLVKTLQARNECRDGSRGRWFNRSIKGLFEVLPGGYELINLSTQHNIPFTKMFSDAGYDTPHLTYTRVNGNKTEYICNIF